ncbi:MAG: allantoicase [Acidimicrobiia bacterium]|jgi:allantoicase
MIDLLSERVGGRVVECSDEFFAAAANLISFADPIANDDYTDRGKWMDGWETRRRREPGHDWCVLALGIPGLVRSVTVDTSHFTGNYPEHFSLDASPGQGVWAQMIPKTPLDGDSVVTFDVDFPHRVAELRLAIFPDGGVARLRVHGTPIPDMQSVCPEGATDLVSAKVGGIWLEASDYHYSPPSNLLLPTDSAGMWDGWETRRRRGPGHDWATFRLGIPGEVDSIDVDTSHFKGNSPGWVSFDVSDDGENWTTVASQVEVAADTVNRIAIGHDSTVRYVRLSLHPDGGVARLRVMGSPAPGAAGQVRIEYLNSLFDEAAEDFFRTACASRSWVDGMLRSRPFEGVDVVWEQAEQLFAGLSETDWLEAFAAHPRIGERGDETSDREQVATMSASRETIRDLLEVNREYEERFGFTYIVHATGKSADEMLQIARDRLENDRATEISNAAGQQKRITATRLGRMLCQNVT